MAQRSPTDRIENLSRKQASFRLIGWGPGSIISPEPPYGNPTCDVTSRLTTRLDLHSSTYALQK